MFGGKAERLVLTGVIRMASRNPTRALAVIGRYFNIRMVLDDSNGPKKAEALRGFSANPSRRDARPAQAARSSDSPSPCGRRTSLAKPSFSSARIATYPASGWRQFHPSRAHPGRA